MTRQGVIAVNTNPEVLTAALWSLDLRTDQFFTGMVSGSICCAKLAGIKVATAAHAATCKSSGLRLEQLVRGHRKFIAAVPSSKEYRQS
jgi:hypothetical protein